MRFHYLKKILSLDLLEMIREAEQNNKSAISYPDNARNLCSVDNHKSEIHNC